MKQISGMGLISEKAQALYVQLNERAEAATSSYFTTCDFYNMFILCLWLRIIRRSGLGFRFMNFPSQMFFNDINHGYRAAILKKNTLWLIPFYMAVTTSCYYEKMHRIICTTIVSYLLNSSRW